MTMGGGNRRTESGEGPSYRLFFAVEVPEAATEALVSWQEKHLRQDPALRLTPPGQLHVTLVFLGQMGEDQRKAAAASMEGLEGRSSFAVTLAGMVGLPRGRSPRVIAAAIEDPAGRIVAIHDELAAGLVKERLYKREKRPYFPHVTIARARGRPHLDPVEVKPDPVQFTAVRVTLYNSILRPDGAEHVALQSVKMN